MSIELPVTSADNLSSLTSVSHGFYGREGGVSEGLYSSLNAGPGSDDDPLRVAENRSRIAKHIGAKDADHLMSLYQIHSSTVYKVTGPFTGLKRPQGDGMVTNTPGIALCILTADCTPVLFADADAGVVGAAHAGWKGALAGIIDSTLSAMMRLGAKPERICAALGPSLSPDSFEVGPDLKAPFIEKHPWSEAHFTPGAGDRSQFDIWGYCKQTLRHRGVENIQCVEQDTLSQPNRYFSNRWRVNENQSDYGRNASVIMLR